MQNIGAIGYYIDKKLIARRVMHGYLEHKCSFLEARFTSRPKNYCKCGFIVNKLENAHFIANIRKETEQFLCSESVMVEAY